MKVEGRGLHGLLFVTGELGEALDEGVGNAKVHSGLIFHGNRQLTTRSATTLPLELVQEFIGSTGRFIYFFGEFLDVNVFPFHV